MARKSTAKSAVNYSAAVTSVAAADIEPAECNKVVNKRNTETLEDWEEIEVESLVPNVSYKDSRTNDIFEWEEIGHVEYMTVGTLKNMWRNNKGYFRHMLLKPNDDRIISQFGLFSTYEKYDFLMDEVNYNRQNIDLLCDAISSTPNGLKYTIYNKVKSLVLSGTVSDIIVIRALEKHLNLDLTSFLA